MAPQGGFRILFAAHCIHPNTHATVFLPDIQAVGSVEVATRKESNQAELHARLRTISETIDSVGLSVSGHTLQGFHVYILKAPWTRTPLAKGELCPWVIAPLSLGAYRHEVDCASVGGPPAVLGDGGRYLDKRAALRVAPVRRTPLLSFGSSSQSC